MLKDSFCSSPWFHIRVNYNGDFIPCRWQPKTSVTNIKDVDIIEFYNSEQMKTLRTDMLTLGECSIVKFLASVGYKPVSKAYNTSFFIREVN